MMNIRNTIYVATGPVGARGPQGPAGPDYSVSAPVSPTDNKGLIVDTTSGVINLEFADSTHNGILSTTVQTIAGLKTFPDTINSTVSGVEPVITKNGTRFIHDYG